MAKEDCAAAADTSHGDIYSEDEADDFKRPNPHVTRPEDLRSLALPLALWALALVAAIHGHGRSPLISRRFSHQ